MNWITLALIAATITIALASTESAFADDKVVKQLTLDDVFGQSLPSIKETKMIDELKKLEEQVGIKIDEQEITKKSSIVQELLQTYDELLDPSVMDEIKKGDIERAHNIVKAHTEKVKDVVKITPTNNIQKDGIAGSVSSLNNFIPKQLNMLDIFG
jgi:hypothetical protein